MTWIYKFLKALVQLAIHLYYPNTKIANRQALRGKGPAIYVSNHPNTLMDPLQVGANTRRQLRFLANAGLFQTPFTNWFFSTFYCIPIQRKEDKGKRVIDNKDSFKRIDDFLSDGGCLFIAPEGTSWMSRVLRRIKTGTARIAFSAEANNDFSLDLEIVPVGLNYEAPDHFRTDVFVNVGDPIHVKSFRKLYESDPYDAVHTLTNEIEKRISSLMLNAQSEEEEGLIKIMEKILQNQYGIEGQELFKKAKIWQQQLRAMALNTPDKYNDLIQLMKQYEIRLKELRTNDRAVLKASTANLVKPLPLLLPGFPIFAFGAVNHAPSVGLVSWLITKLQLYIGYKSAARIMGSLIFMPLSYWLFSEVVESYFGTAWSWWYLLSLPLTGYFAIWYRDHLLHWLRMWRIWRKPEEHEKLKNTRATIFQRLQATLPDDQKTDL